MRADNNKEKMKYDIIIKKKFPKLFKAKESLFSSTIESSKSYENISNTFKSAII